MKWRDIDFPYKIRVYEDNKEKICYIMLRDRPARRFNSLDDALEFLVTFFKGWVELQRLEEKK